MGSVVVQDPTWHEHVRDATGRFINAKLMETIATDVRRDCPKKTHKLVNSIRVLGNQMWVGGPTAPYWADVEYDTPPHMIYPVRAKALRWEDESGVHFAKKVHHPGTTGQRFIRNNFYRYRNVVYF